MASVGDQGCGFEHQLEAAYRALHDCIPREPASCAPTRFLAVVFVTDEDDCSAPTNTICSSRRPATYGTLHSFRCTQYGVACCGALVPAIRAAIWRQLHPTAEPRDGRGGKLFDVQRYIDFFTKPAAQGGVKADPDDVILAAIDRAPSRIRSASQITERLCQDQVNTRAARSCSTPA